VESRFFGYSRRRTFLWVFLIAGSAVFALADWLGILSAPYTRPPLDLRSSDHEEAADKNSSSQRT
jgi:hypothetical protein